jgi:hypothetical protein
MKIVDKLINLVILVTIIFLILFLNNKYVPSSHVNTLLTSLLIALISLYIQTVNITEKFTFEVSKNKPKCNVKGLVGRPISVDFEKNCGEFDDKQYSGYLGKPGTFIGV